LLSNPAVLAISQFQSLQIQTFVLQPVEFYSIAIRGEIGFPEFLFLHFQEPRITSNPDFLKEESFQKAETSNPSSKTNCWFLRRLAHLSKLMEQMF